MADQDTMNVCNEIFVERLKQNDEWGERNHTPLKWLAILGEEFGEACKGELELDDEGFRKELIQVAAVAVAAIESGDRRQMQVAIDEAQKAIQEAPDENHNQGA